MTVNISIKLAMAGLALWMVSCSPKPTAYIEPQEDPSADLNSQIASSEILWDKWGVPHIYASNNNDLFYSFGWAQMHHHANTILKLYGKSRGRASEYWGKEYFENDALVHTLGFHDLASEWFDSQSAEFQKYIIEFVRGLNNYAQAHPQEISPEFQAVLPLENEDVFRHALFVLYSRFIGGIDLQQVSRWEGLGSNTYAIAPTRTTSGNAMLVMNPHLPWFDEWLFFEAHFNTPDLNLYGATLVGFPTLGIAFNEFLGWSHTNNTIDNSDRYEIELQDGGYLLDGVVHKLTTKEKIIKIRQEDGSIKNQSLPIVSSPHHGPILKQAGNKALTIKMPGFDRPFGMVQWWNMGNSKTLDEFKSALKEIQIGFFNIMYADRAGNIFYMFNGQIPKRKHGDWSFWNRVVDGSKAENLWSEVHSFSELPMVENPVSGFLQNANDPPWTCTFPMELDPEDYPPYFAPVTMSFRPQRATRMIMEDEKISFDELVDYKMSTRIEMADRLLDDLFIAIDEFGGEKSKRAKIVLSRWDRQADASSKGMALFYSWAQAIRPFNPDNYSVPWKLENARHTPDGLANPKKAVKTLEDVVSQFDDVGRPLDIPWGEVYRIRYNGLDLPGNGSDGSVGIFRVAWSNGAEDDGTYSIAGGDSWQAVIEFGEKVRAKVTMSYGQSTQQGSPNNGDQLTLFSKKEMRTCAFYRDDVEKQTVRKEILELGAGLDLSN